MSALRIALLIEIVLCLILWLDVKAWLQIAPESNFSGWLLVIIWPSYWFLFTALIISTVFHCISAVKKHNKNPIILSAVNIGLFLLCSFLYFFLLEHIGAP